MPEFMVKTSARTRRIGLAARRADRAAVAADQASEPADYRSAPFTGPAAAPIRRAPTVPGRPGSALSVRRQPCGTEDRWQRTEDMQITTCHASTGAVWADALFVSVLQRSDKPDAGQVRQAIAAAIRAHGDQGCAQQVAQEFGDHPETAVARMHWARAVASTMLARRRGLVQGTPATQRPYAESVRRGLLPQQWQEQPLPDPRTSNS